MCKANIMKKIVSFMLILAAPSWASLAYASPRDNFVYTEFSNCVHVQRTDGGFIAVKEDGSIGYYDAFGNATDDVVSAAGGNVFNVGSENEDVDAYDPETDTGMHYTRRYYYLYDNHNRLMERLASDAYDIRQTDNYIITANMDDAIENIKIRFYEKETGVCVSELPASAYRIWSGSGEDAGFDLSYLSMTKSGQFIFVGQNGLCGTADVYGNIGLEPSYPVLQLLDAEKEYFITRLDDKLCVLDKTGAVIKTMEEPGIRTFSKLGEVQGKLYYETGDADYMNHLLDENFNEIKMPDRMEFAGFLDMDKGLIKVMRPIVERANTYYANEAVIDLQGNVVIPFEEDLCNLELLGDNLISAYRFSDSPIPAGLGWSKTCPYVILDRQGKMVVDSCDRFTQAGDNGWVGIQKGEESFYIDQSGKVVLYPPEGYAVQGPFSEGLASVEDRNTLAYSGYGITAYQTAYMDETGKIVIEGDSDWGEGAAFENGIASIVRYPGNAMPTQTTYIKYVGNAPSAWAEDLVGKAREMGILKDEAVYYRLAVSRETFCELVYALLDTMPGIQWERPAVNPFRDTENEKVLALSACGIIEGKGEGRFAPHDSLTREEAATIALRIGKLVKLADVGGGDDGMYADHEAISDWAKEAVYALRRLGIMQGTDRGFEPKAQYTLEESLVTLMRLYNRIEQQ